MFNYYEVMKLTSEQIYERYESAGLTLVRPSSTNIGLYGYIESVRQLIVRFKPKSKTYYIYRNFPIEKFRELDKLQTSKGSYIYHNVKGKHAYERLFGELPL